MTGSELLTAAIREGSGWHSVVRVHHGPVVYDDDAGEVLCATISDHASGLAAHFFKRTQFRDQQEYRFVLSAPGGRPIDEEFHLEISPELRSVFERR